MVSGVLGGLGFRVRKVSHSALRDMEVSQDAAMW